MKLSIIFIRLFSLSNNLETISSHCQRFSKREKRLNFLFIFYFCDTFVSTTLVLLISIFNKDIFAKQHIWEVLLQKYMINRCSFKHKRCVSKTQIICCIAPINSYLQQSFSAHFYLF